MDQHPIPRQITSFEFKLIGFLTIKQFLYLLVFVGVGLAVYALTPIPILNYFLGIVTASIGLAFAFVPINDRPMEVWVKNLVKRLTSPTQYNFQKANQPIKILQDFDMTSNPHLVASHIDSQNKLNSYLAGQTPTTTNAKRQTINDLLTNPVGFLTKKPKSHPEAPGASQASQPAPAVTSPSLKHPFINGVIKNHKLTPLAGILIYVKKDEQGTPLRIFKSNLHGIFSSYNPLPSGEYFFEAKDPKQAYLFDTMKIRIENVNNTPIEMLSKELI